MVNITHKSNTLRQAIASALVTVSKQETIEAINGKKVPKGDIFEFSRAAGLLAIKKTSDVIPDCHPLPVEYAAIGYGVEGLTITIKVEVHTIYKTGVEVEAMHGAAIAALTMYDMLKPLDKGVEISSVKLLSKKGGKSDTKQASAIKAAVIVCSDTVAAKKAEDGTGKRVIEKLEQHGIAAERYDIIADDATLIRAKAEELCNENYQLVLFAGGTGVSPRDVTPDALASLIDKEIPGIMEAARNYGQQRTPYAMLSRGIAGFIKNTLVITLPGSVRGAEETMDALFPYVLHVFQVAAAMRHETI